MPLKPNFRDQFGEYLKGPAGPLARATVRELNGRIDSLEKQISALRKSPIPFRRALEYAIGEINERLKDGAGQISSDIAGLRDALHRRANNYPANTDVFVLSLLRKFCRFDEDAILAAFVREFPDDVESVDPEVEIARLEDEIDLLELEIEEAWPVDVASLSKFFRDDRVPGFYLGMQLGVNADADQIAERICDDFLFAYRDRARLFRSPVTFNGIAISSLTGKKKDTWSALWSKLKLSQAQLQDVYTPIYESSPEDTTEPENPMFAR